MSSCGAAGKLETSSMKSGSQGAASGRNTRPASTSGVMAAARVTLSLSTLMALIGNRESLRSS